MRRSEFADLIGISRGRVTQLANEGRLVLADDGKDVLVDPSLDLLAATCQVDKIGENIRRAIERRRNGVPILQIIPPTQSSPTKSPEPYPDYNRARAENEIKRGEQLDIELAQLRGELISRVGVLQSIQTIAAVMRATLDKLPDNLASRLAVEADPNRVYEIIQNEVDAICESSRKAVLEALGDL